MNKPAPELTTVADEWHLFHEWFAGWRWEHHRSGELIAESLHSFETREECIADSRRARRAPREALISVPRNHPVEGHAPAQRAA